MLDFYNLRDHYRRTTNLELELDKKIKMIEGVAGGEIPRTERLKEDLLRLAVQAQAINNALTGNTTAPAGGTPPPATGGGGSS